MTNKILLVEDEEEIRDTIAAELVDAGYQVIQSANGREGLEAIEREKPDLILSDISMPEIDGIAMLEALRTRLPDQIDTPVIFLTAYSDRDRQIAARRHGADEFLNKPVDLELLLAVIANQLKKKSSAKEQHDAELVNLFRKMQSHTGNGHAPSAGLPVRDEPTTPAQERVVGRSKEFDPRNPAADLGGVITLIGLKDIKQKLGSRWDKVASTVRHLAENRIAQNVAGTDTYRMVGEDSFEVCVRGRTEAESLAIVRRTKQQILEDLGTIEVDDGTNRSGAAEPLASFLKVGTEFYPMPPTPDAPEDDLLDVISAKIKRAAADFLEEWSKMLATIVQDGHVTLLRVLDHNLVPTQFASCALDPTTASTEQRMRNAFAQDDQKLLELDMAKLGLAVQAVIRAASPQLSSFIVSVDVNSVRNTKNRQKYLSLLSNVPHGTRSKFVFLIENGLGDVHVSLLMDLIRSLKPFSITCWLRATAPEPIDRSINEAVVPIVVMNCLDFETAIKTIPEKLKIFRKNIAARKILLMVDSIIDAKQQINLKKWAPNYYCFDGNCDINILNQNPIHPIFKE